MRHIYTDGRRLGVDPKFHGFIGRAGMADTLGGRHRAFADDAAGGQHPHSDKMRISERFRLVEPDLMNIETTITDPEALTAPFVSSRTLRRHRDWTLAEYICEENNRNSVDQNGKAGVNLAVPGGAPAKK